MTGVQTCALPIFWADGAKAAANPEDVATSEQKIAGTQSLKISLAPGGGYVAVFSPAN